MHPFRVYCVPHLWDKGRTFRKRLCADKYLLFARDYGFMRPKFSGYRGYDSLRGVVFHALIIIYCAGFLIDYGRIATDRYRDPDSLNLPEILI